MKNIVIFCLLFVVITFSSCSVIGDIFKAGVWVGVLAVAAVVGVIIYFFTKGSRRK